MSKKYTKDDYFAAASAHDLWAYLSFSYKRWAEFRENNPTCKNDPDFSVLDCCETEYTPYLLILDKAQEIGGFQNDWLNEAYLSAQIGCEKAGL